MFIFSRKSKDLQVGTASVTCGKIGRFFVGLRMTFIALKLKNLLKFTTFIFIVCFIFAAPSVRAISVSPAMVEVTIDKDAVKDGYITVKNTEDRSVAYDVSLRNFVSRGEEGQQDFVGSNLVFQDADWIVPQSESLTLEPREKVDFQYKIRTPKDARPGGHYIAMFFAKKISASPDGTSAIASSKIGVLFFIRVNGEIEENLSIESFRLMQNRGFFNRLPVVFETRYKNSGNVHVRPEGEIVIKNFLGNVSAKIPLNPKSSLVLTGGIRRTESQWEKSVAASGDKKSGWFKELENEWRNFAIGPYTAAIQGFYGEGKLPLSARVKFWIMPWHILATAVFIATALIALARIYRWELIRAMLKKTKNR